MSKKTDKTDISNASHSQKRKERLIVYQFFPRILTNRTEKPEPWGTLEKNGSGKFNDITDRVLQSIRGLGVNTVWLTGVIEHATKTDFSKFGIAPDHKAIVKGEAGSPYAIKDYYDVDPALAVSIDKRLEEFQETVDRIHKAGLKVLIDFVPNHTARVYHSDQSPEGITDFGKEDDPTKFFDKDNNYYYIPNQLFSPSLKLEEEKEAYKEFPAKATGNDCFSAFCGEEDWYETVKLNYGVDYGDGTEHFDPIPSTWIKMLHILRYWAAMGIDGFRCDMVFMVPLKFWHWAIPQIKKDYPSIIFIGEIYDVDLYRPFLDYGGFDYLYDKVNLYDTLVSIERSNCSAAKLTDCWKAVDGLGSRMLNFLENHDEVRFASKEFANDPARIIPHLIVSSMISKGPFMIYYGQEFGERGEDNEGFAGNNNRTTIFDYWSIDTVRRWYNNGNCDETLLNAHEKWLRRFYSKALGLCNLSAALREGNFFDLMYANLQYPDFDPHSLYSWIRYCDKEALLLIVNFSKEEKRINLHIPKLAFDMASLKEGEIYTEDLLWEQPIGLKLKIIEPLKLKINPSDAMVVRLRGEIQE